MHKIRSIQWRSVWRVLRSSQQPKSLFGQIMLWMLLPLMVLWPMSLVISYPIGRSIADAPFDQLLAQQVQLLRQHIQYDAPNKPWQAMALNDQDKQMFQVTTVDGIPIEGEWQMPQPPLRNGIELDKTRFYNTQWDNHSYRVAYQWMQLNDSAPFSNQLTLNTVVLIQVGETLNKRQALAQQILQGVTLPQLLFLPIAVMLIWFGLTRGIMSLSHLQSHVLNRNEHDLSSLSVSSTPQELQPLVRSFNNVLAKLRRSIGLQKQFLTNSAHQMKTPLAGLKAQVELALNTPDETQRQECLVQIGRSADRAARLSSQLIALARTEHVPRQGSDWKQCDLTQIAREQLLIVADHALSRGLVLAFEAPDTPVWLNAHPMLLGELIKNLLDNACYYTASDVTLRIGVHDTAIHLAVLDNGPGIPMHERDQVFEPFYSVLGVNKGGSGLGLAIVKEIAQMHKAHVRVSDNLDLGLEHAQPGCRVLVVFPHAHLMPAP